MKRPIEMLSSSPEPCDGGPVHLAVRSAEVGVDLERVGRVERPHGDAVGAALRREAKHVDPVELDRLTSPAAREAGAVTRGGHTEALVGARALEHQRVEFLVELDADAIEAPALDLEPLVAEVHLEPPVSLAEGDGLGLRASLDEQRATLDPDGRRTLDEVALPVASGRPPEIAADALGEVSSELSVGQLGDQHQTTVKRHRPAEELLTRGLIGEQALAQVLGLDARHLELDRVDLVVGRGKVIEGEDRLLAEPAADLVGDPVELVVGHIVDVETPGALERRGTEVGGEEHAVHKLGAARLAAAVLDDFFHVARERP